MTIRPEDIRGLSPSEIAARFSPQEIQEALSAARAPSTSVSEPAGVQFDDVTKYDPNEDFFSAKNMGSLASNIVPSAVRMGEDVYNTVTSPVETAKAVWDAGPSGILSALGERFGGVENIKRTAVEDPFGLALDVAPGLQAAGAGLKAARIGTRLGGVLSKANPIGATARTAAKAGSATGAVARSAASAASGIDSGVLSTAREVLGATPRSLAGEALGEGVDAGQFLRKSRQEFRAATRGAGPQDVQQSIKKVTEGINTRLDDIAERGKAQFGDVPIDPASYDQMLEGLNPRLSKRGVALEVTDEGRTLDFSESVIPRKKKAHGRVTESVDYAFEPLAKENPTIGDAWMARKRIDNMRGAAARKGRDAEAGMIRQVRQNVDDYLASIDNREFQQFNSEYAAGAAMREHFEQLVSGKVDPDTQVASLIRSIKSGRKLSEQFLQGVEAQTGVPLRAIAAGTELSDILPRGLIGRSMAAGLATSVLGPEALAAVLLTPPKLIGVYLRMIGATERTVRTVGDMVNQVMSLPKAAALAEQGLTFGAMVNQLKREEPSLMGRIGAVNR